MIQYQKNNISFLRFPNLDRFPELRHAVFTRNGGISKGPYAELNVGMGVGDAEENVRHNRMLISQCMDGGEPVFIRQVHGDEIVTVSGQADEAGQTGDAVITRLTEKNLVIQVADCQAVLLYDPEKQAVGNIHSGWRGSVQNIIGKTVQAMTAAFGTDPKNLFAGISPSLGPCCAEFVNYRREIPEIYWPYRDDTDHFDFWAVSRDQLTAEGVPPDHIHTSRLCTRCRTGLFFSYRNEHTTGRFAAVIGLRKKAQAS